MSVGLNQSFKNNVNNAMLDVRDIFSKGQSLSIKGLFALIVLLHHTYQQMNICQNLPFVDYFLRSLGYLAVGIFFFISGYGLYKSMIANKKVSISSNGGGIIRCYTECCRYFSLTSF